MLLFDGQIDRVRSIGSVRLFHDALDRQSPQWWWPGDQSWFVGTEIDYPWKVGIDGVLRTADCERRSLQAGGSSIPRTWGSPCRNNVVAGRFNHHFVSVFGTVEIALSTISWSSPLSKRRRRSDH